MSSLASNARELGTCYPKGVLVFEQGEFADCLYVVQKGKIELSVRTAHGEVSLDVVGSGEIFGATSLFTADKSRFSVARALEDSLVLRVDEKTLIARLHQDPSLAFRLIRLMAQRVYNLEHQWVRYVQCGEGIDAGRIADSADPAGPAMLPNVFDFSIGYHILIVEDDTEFYHLLERWLSRGELGKDSPILPETVRLLRAVQIQEALSHLCHDKFDVVILDLNLPDSQGMESFRRVHDRFPDTPIVVLSAMDDDQQAIVAVRQGAQDYLVKSTVNRERLLHSVRYAVERRCVRMGGDGDDASRTGNRRDPAKRTSGSLLACVRAWLRRVWERRRF